MANRYFLPANKLLSEDATPVPSNPYNTKADVITQGAPPTLTGRKRRIETRPGKEQRGTVQGALVEPWSQEGESGETRASARQEVRSERPPKRHPTDLSQ